MTFECVETISGRESVLRYLRLAAGISREKLAEDTGVSADEILLFENGSRWIPMDKVMKLARYFAVSCSALLWDDFEETADLFCFPIRRSEFGRGESGCSRQEYRQRLGDAGEEWVVEQERRRLDGTSYANAVNPNYAKEEGAHFDILSFTIMGEPVCIEVKATAGDEEQPFFLTAAELRFVERCLYEGKRYELHRVIHVDDPVRCSQTVYSAREVLELFDRLPSAYLMCRKGEPA